MIINKIIVSENGLVKLLAKKFKKENKELYNFYDFEIAKKLYVTFMLGTYEPKRIRGIER